MCRQTPQVCWLLLKLLVCDDMSHCRRAQTDGRGDTVTQVPLQPSLPWVNPASTAQLQGKEEHGHSEGLRAHLGRLFWEEAAEETYCSSPLATADQRKDTSGTCCADFIVRDGFPKIMEYISFPACDKSQMPLRSWEGREHNRAQPPIPTHKGVRGGRGEWGGLRLQQDRPCQHQPTSAAVTARQR